MEAGSVLEVEHLIKTYRSRRRGEIKAVDDASFSVERGEIVGLLGPNGAGKTTTIKCLCTLVTPTSGKVFVDGANAVDEPRAAVAKLAAVLEGNRNVYWRLTPRENLEFFAALHGIPRRSVGALLDELLERFNLEDQRDVESRTLSRGMQQKLAVACAFVKQTPILLLDEPTLGLDVETSHELRAMLRDMAGNAGRTILLSSHDMDVVQDVCDRVIVINNGRIVTSDRVSNLLALFQARAYRFVVRGEVDGALRDALASAFDKIEISSDDGVATIDVELLDAERLYELVDLLRSRQCLIDSIDRRDPDLEEIFLRILRGEVRS
ncbi:MAG: ABC transporter ATP-binding protein [Actinomycetota bacterium]